ncbi:YciI family protein [Pollutibacter soli]|uniref:YciI family protein n=1 Tax=Pollutibacter soli TaxID=3034157 RepID=UPI003013F3B6
MKRLATLLLIFTSIGLQGQSTNPKFNKALADSLGADEYGMKMYTFVILKSKENTLDKKIKDSLMVGHMQNINKLADAGKLIVAGPMGQNDKKYRGIFIFNTSDLKEAKSWVETDPSVKGGIFDVELFPWYGSAALPLYLKHHEEVEKTKF